MEGMFVAVEEDGEDLEQAEAELWLVFKADDDEAEDEDEEEVEDDDVETSCESLVDNEKGD